MSSQRHLGDLDRNFVGSCVAHGCLGDAGQLDDVIADLFRQFFQCAFVFWACERDVEYIATRFDQCGDGFFGFSRESIDRVDPVLDLIQCLRFVGIFEQLNRHGADTLAGI